MAGTDSTKAAIAGSAPAVILVDPQMGENIGAAARAMGNFGLSDLRLVRPRDGWPNPRAEAMAAGAPGILENARVYERTEDAIGDLSFVVATTARDRTMIKSVLTPHEAGRTLRAEHAAGRRTGLLFGAERVGLVNDDVALADAILTIPSNPAFSSFNLGQAVLLVSYEWFRQGDDSPSERIEFGDTRPATKDEIVGLFTHLEDELDAAGFLFPPDKRPSMVRNLRNLWNRARLTEQDVRTLRGVVASLAGRTWKKKRSDDTP